MKNWKTTLAGLVAFLALNGEMVGLSAKQTKVITGAAVAAGFIVAQDKEGKRKLNDYQRR